MDSKPGLIERGNLERSNYWTLTLQSEEEKTEIKGVKNNGGRWLSKFSRGGTESKTLKIRTWKDPVIWNLYFWKKGTRLILEQVGVKLLEC